MVKRNYIPDFIDMVGEVLTYVQKPRFIINAALKVKRSFLYMIFELSDRLNFRRTRGFFMKDKIFAAFISLIVLSATTDLWFSHKGKITFFGDLKTGTEVSLNYRKKPDSRLIILKKEVKENGRVSFKTKGGTIFWFKIDLPENAAVQKTEFRGWKKQKITLTGQNEYTGKALNNRVSINWYNLIIIGGLAYYFVWFLAHSFHYGFPKDNPGLPKMLNIEFLRIVFTLGIVFTHVANSCCSERLDIWNYAGLGVEFFFILSGFLLACTFNPEKTVLTFLKSKIIRFLPLILFVSIVRGIFANQINVTNMFSDFLFLPVPGLHHTAGFVNVAWYINVMLWVSLFYFSLMKFYRKETVNIIIGLITFFAYTALASKGWDRLGSINEFVKINLLRALGGMGIGYFLKQISELKIKTTHLYNLFEVLIITFAISAMYVQKIAMANPIYYVILFAVVIFCFVQKKGKMSLFFEKPVFASLSKYALSVYLAQEIITTDLFGYAFSKYPEILKQHSFLTVFITLFLACMLGFVVHHTVELPAGRALKKNRK